MSPTLPLSPDQPTAPAVGSPLHEPAVLHHEIFMPRHGEPIHAYAARLRAIQHHLTMLIEAVERGMSHRPAKPHIDVRHPRLGAGPAVLTAAAPGLGPAPAAPAFGGRPAARPQPMPARDADPPARDGDDRRGEPTERRVGLRDRRQGHPDRRRGLIDLRADKVERRAGPRDRRSGRRDRRLGHDRRADARRAAAPATAGAGPHVDPVAVFWGVNIICWLGITAVAMIWGVG